MSSQWSGIRECLAQVPFDFVLGRQVEFFEQISGERNTTGSWDSVECFILALVCQLGIRSVVSGVHLEGRIAGLRKASRSGVEKDDSEMRKKNPAEGQMKRKTQHFYTSERRKACYIACRVYIARPGGSNLTVHCRVQETRASQIRLARTPYPAQRHAVMGYRVWRSGADVCSSILCYCILRSFWAQIQTSGRSWQSIAPENG